MKQDQLKKLPIIASILVAVMGMSNSHSLLADTTPKQSIYLTQRDDDFRIKLYEKAKKAVVQVSTKEGLGSGFIVTPDGLVITNIHVVKEAGKIVKTVTIKLYDGTELTAEVVGFHQNQDLALLKIPNQHKLPTLALASPDSLKVGQSVHAIGSPLGLESSFTSGTLNQIYLQESRLEHDARITFGNSGGPLLNSQGQVIGINTYFKSLKKGDPSIGFAISVDQVYYLLKAYKERVPPFVSREDSGTIKVADLPTNGQIITAKLQKGDRVRDNNAYLHYYTFEGQADQRLTLEMSSKSVDSVLILYLVTKNAEGEINVEEVARNEGISSKNPNARIATSLPKDGKYLVEASSFQPGESGEYSLKATLR